MQVASMLADLSSSAPVVPGTQVNGLDDMTGDLELNVASVLYVSGEESIQQVTFQQILQPRECTQLLSLL